ncbi:MAG: hypothetical protein WA956_07310 [Stenotrophomonas sp.]
MHVNGHLTLGENITAVAGLATAHDVCLLSQQGMPRRHWKASARSSG